jgi:hypothetical protein
MSNVVSLKNIVTAAVVASLLAIAAVSVSNGIQTSRSSWGKVVADADDGSDDGTDDPARSSWGRSSWG